MYYYDHVFCFFCIVVVILSKFTNVIGTRTHYIVLWYVALSKMMTITTLLSLRNVVEYVFSYIVCLQTAWPKNLKQANIKSFKSWYIFKHNCTIPEIRRSYITADKFASLYNLFSCLLYCSGTLLSQRESLLHTSQAISLVKEIKLMFIIELIF